MTLKPLRTLNSVPQSLNPSKISIPPKVLSLRIALRYLFAPKSHKAVNVISLIAVVGVAVATMAIVVVLSVFNGFTDLSARHLARIDPDLMVLPAQGKVFGGVDSLRRLVLADAAVERAMPSLQERALAVSGDRQMPVVVKGVEQVIYPSVVPFDSLIIDGTAVPDSLTVCLAVGPAMQLAHRPSPEEPLQLYVPRRRGRVNPANPAAAYRSAVVAVSGVFAVEQPEYDNDYVVADISLLRRLLDYDDRTAGALEVRLVPGADADKAAERLGEALGDGFVVQTRALQHPETFRMIAVEKWVTFLMLVFILVVASFNIITTLSLLVIEKRSDMATLRALGATHGTVAGVFAWEGTLITIAGGLAGIAIGAFLAWLQQTFGLIKLGGDPSALTISVYPVRIAGSDIAMVAATLLLLSIVLGQISRFFTRQKRRP